MNINTALGMVERPLPTGIYYENKYELRRVDPLRDEVAELREQLAASKDTLASMQYSEAQHDLACEELGINLFPHEDGDTLIEAVCRLKEQLATVTRERDEAQRKYETQCQGSMSDKRRIAHLETTVRNYQSAANKIAVELSEVTSDRDALREQLATVQRVLVESLNLAEVGNEFAPPCVDVDNAMSLAAATEVAIDTLKLSAEKHKLDAEEANKALATVQAVAAAMRREIAKLPDYREIVMPYGDPGHVVSNSVIFEIKRSAKGTAGRELLDKMKRNSERIREIENVRKLSSEAYEKISNSHADLKRQLAEHKRDAELCRELRAFLQEQMEILRGCVVAQKWVGSDTLTAKLNDLLVAVRDGGAK